MKYLFIFTLCVMLSSFAQADSNDIESFIMNGNITEPHQFPFICAYKRINLETNDNRFSCGGTIINENWILTAAHCITEVNTTYPEEIGFHCGKHDLTVEEEGEQFVVAKSYYIHPLWLNSTIGEDLWILSYDIAVVELATPLVFSETVYPIVLADQDYEHKNISATMIGWGIYTFDPVPSVSTRLRYANIDLLTVEECDALIEGTGLSTINIICTDPRDEVTACNGDSGGPLVQLNYEEHGETKLIQIGVTSWGSGVCGTQTSSTGYVGIRYFRDWIDDIINGVDVETDD